MVSFVDRANAAMTAGYSITLSGLTFAGDTTSNENVAVPLAQNATDENVSASFTTNITASVEEYASLVSSTNVNGTATINASTADAILAPTPTVSFGLLANPTVYVGLSSCETAAWASATSVACHVAAGDGAGHLVTATVLGVVGTRTATFSYDGESASRREGRVSGQARRLTYYG